MLAVFAELTMACPKVKRDQVTRINILWQFTGCNNQSASVTQCTASHTDVCNGTPKRSQVKNPILCMPG